METTLTTYSRTQPLYSVLKERTLMSLEGSIKSTYHLSFDLADSGMKYEPGDSLAVLGANPTDLVENVLSLVNTDGADVEQAKEALTTKFLLNRVSKKFVKAVAETSPTLQETVADAEKLDAYCFTRDYVDVLKENPQFKPTLEHFLTLLSPVQPRLYSIASSQLMHPNEVHLTVAVVRYSTHGRDKWGFASGYIGEHLQVGERAPVYTQRTRHFHMPAQADVPMIMVGPGTGIAPFRAFLQHRQATGATGKNWLFFGDQHRHCDYLYGEELEAWHSQGLLTRLDTAFSRDQENKVYVQHRMKENAKELWDWLQNGAYFYVCGDAKRMAKDVHATLIEIAQSVGGMTPEQAKDTIENQLARTEKRYLKDVY